ncbi:MAG TPA: HlyD family efflux transporter periplasmic adaptor subunit [Noviherbaspirillum sp.]|uniref:HlyD family secretion protein n=1 Tax=Noviherbaspirillum sp. TaxID=1926288 RepID=UPI002D3A2D78|nr:HlyD family efflux transporter periplasmic adaptor subunit [Noviherbaspirillum sp.]HYD94788.1 HlyD family efflux transporter periplasmic adaptor subunit [Noviherbaspirillum sp.]
MKPLPAWLAPLAISALLAGCGDKPADYYPGYAEAEYVRLATPIAGTLTKLHVQRGDTLERNAPAFVLEQDSERAAREEAAARVQRAQAQLANLQKGRRAEEVAAVQAQLAQADAALQLSTGNLARQKQLVADKFISAAHLDEARAALERDQARVNELRAQLRIARLGARPDEIDAARQELHASRAQLTQAEWKLAQKTQRAPVGGAVADVLYREGEFVQSGSPVVSVLPPQNIKLRFFVPQAQLGTLRIGQAVLAHCDGCGAAVPAKISYISAAPEYTAPLIYSKENRATLVFMIEARPAPEQAASLHPGQPVEIRLAQAK